MAKRKVSKKPQLRLCAAAWTMTNYPSAEKEWTIDRKMKAAKEAGFAGFSVVRSSKWPRRALNMGFSWSVALTWVL